MTSELPSHNPELPPGLEMYFHPEVARLFAEREQNERNFRTAALLDRLIMLETATLPDPLYAAELGGGAHPDRYHKLFGRLLGQPRGHIDWVDISPVMLELAHEYLNTEKYREREQVIRFVPDDIVHYLNSLPDGALNLGIMKYTFDYFTRVEDLLEPLSRKLSSPGRFVSSMTDLSPELKSVSANARMLYRGQAFPDNETRTLMDGEAFGIKFFTESGNPNAPFLPGAETTKYYHSPETIRRVAQELGFDCFLDDWKNLIPGDLREGEDMKQAVLVLRKSK